MSGDLGWVSARGGALDRVVVLSAALLGLCAAGMAVVTVVRGAWVGTAFWAVLLVLSLVVGVRAGGRVRGVSRPGSP